MLNACPERQTSRTREDEYYSADKRGERGQDDQEGQPPVVTPVVRWKLLGADQGKQRIFEDLHTPDHPGHIQRERQGDEERPHKPLLLSVVPCFLMKLRRSKDRLYSSQDTLECLCSFVALFYQFVRR